ncbi:hypothetical protein THAOC_21990, partial [Thalassiosira oceanica]
MQSISSDDLQGTTPHRTHKSPFDNMSFNFSGGEEDEESDLELDRFDTSGLLAQQSRKCDGVADSSSTDLLSPPAAAAAALPTTPGKDPVAFESDDEDEDDIGWEDGHNDWEDASVDGDIDEVHQDGADRLMAEPEPEGHLLIDVDASKGASAQKQQDPEPPKKKKRRVNKVLQMSKQNRRSLLDIRRSLMLASVAHATQSSSMCGSTDSNDEAQSLLFHVALSMIPEEFHPHEDEAGVIVPTKQDLQRFLQWFFQLVNRAGRRRRNGPAGGVSSTRRRTRSSNGRKVNSALVTPNTEDGARQTQFRQNASASSIDCLLQLLTCLSPTSGVDAPEA